MRYALIIDDNEVGIQVLSKLLEMVGFKSMSLQDARLLEDIGQEIYDCEIIFLDLEMPNINGYEVLESLKNEAGITAPIIAYTVNVNEMVSAKQAGFDGFLSKPLRKDRFPEQIDRILRGQPVWEAD